jgi:hypothetical protein
MFKVPIVQLAIHQDSLTYILAGSYTPHHTLNIHPDNQQSAMTMSSEYPWTREEMWITILKEVRDRAVAHQASKVRKTEDYKETTHLGSGIDTNYGTINTVIDKIYLDNTPTKTSDPAPSSSASGKSSEESPVVSTQPSSENVPKTLQPHDCGFEFCDGLCEIAVNNKDCGFDYCDGFCEIVVNGK